MSGFLKVFFVIVGYVVLFDVAGVAVSFVLGILPFDSITTALFYVVWFVAGVFCGLLAYNKAGSILLPVNEGDWAGAPGSGKVGLEILVLTTLILGGFSFLFYKLTWQHGWSSEPFVPDHMPMSITYFVSIFGAMIFGHVVVRPSTVTK